MTNKTQTVVHSCIAFLNLRQKERKQQQSYTRDTLKAESIAGGLFAQFSPVQFSGRHLYEFETLPDIFVGERRARLKARPINPQNRSN